MSSMCVSTNLIVCNGLGGNEGVALIQDVLVLQDKWRYIKKS